MTVVAMAFREHLDVKLGFIALSGAVSLVLLLELLRGPLKPPPFDEILGELDWRAILFYIALFALVGGLEKMKVIDMLAQTSAPHVRGELRPGRDGPLLGDGAHRRHRRARRLHPDVPLPIREMQDDGIPAWPLWWMLLWSGTLGSNLTVAGAPALFAALNICEREEKRKVSLREFLSWSVPFTLLAAGVCYVIGMLVWVLPYAR